MYDEIEAEVINAEEQDFYVLLKRFEGGGNYWTPYGLAYPTREEALREASTEYFHRNCAMWRLIKVRLPIQER